jgi:hypothetical protein
MAELLKRWDEDHPDSDYVALPQAFGPKISFAGSNLLIDCDDIADLILGEIDSYSTTPEYDPLTTGYVPKPKLTNAEYAERWQKHESLISRMSEWVDVIARTPKYGERVFAIHDLRPIGRGRFVADYYFSEYGFVANEGDTDCYGYITHWISVGDVKLILR